MKIKSKFLKLEIEYEVSDKIWNAYKYGEIELPSLFERIYRKVFDVDIFVVCRMKTVHDLYLGVENKTIHEVVEILNQIDYDKSLKEECAKRK